MKPVIRIVGILMLAILTSNLCGPYQEVTYAEKVKKPPTQRETEVYMAFKHLMDSTELPDKVMYKRVAKQFKIAPSKVKTTYEKVMMHRFSDNWKGSIKDQIQKALKPFDVLVKGTITVSGEFASIRYIEQFSARNNREVAQKATERAKRIANAIFDSSPDLERVRLDAHYAVVDKRSGGNSGTKRIKIFDFDRN